MFISSVKFLLLLSLLILAPWTGLSAQTILVHSPSLNDEADEKLKLYSQSAEAGIMDVLFDLGCITFSEMSDTDESGVYKLAVNSGADYIISWKLEDSGLKGSLVKILKNESIKVAAVGDTELKGTYKDPLILYHALGSKLCETLVKDRL